MKKQTKKILKITWISISVIMTVLSVFYFLGFINTSRSDDGLSIQLYGKNGVLLKEIKPFATIDVGGQITENVGFIKLKYKVTNNGNIPLTIRVIESYPISTWLPASQLIEVNNFVVFESQLIDLSQLTSLQQPISFIVKAQGESPQLVSTNYPTTSDLIQAIVTADVVNVVANIEGDLSLVTESCRANGDFGEQQQEVEVRCSTFTTEIQCGRDEFCSWR